MRQVIAGAGIRRSRASARVRITGQVALADEEFASVAQGAVVGLAGSVVLITLWLFLAVQTWRLIVPILATLGLGLMLTLLFASVAVGTLNLVSVGFGILFVGIAVDFAIQFSVRYRETALRIPRPGRGVAAERARAPAFKFSLPRWRHRLVFWASCRQISPAWRELGLIAGVGMLIAFVCTLRFLPAHHHPVPSARRTSRRGLCLAGAVRSDHRAPSTADPRGIRRSCGAWRWQPRRACFNSDPLHTKNPNTEAMRTLYDLMDDPVTNPYSIDILRRTWRRRRLEAKAGDASDRFEGNQHPEFRAG